MQTGTYRYPTIPGHEFTGRIVSCGPETETASEGLRVTVVPLIPCRKCSYCAIGEYHLCADYDYLGSRTNGAFAEFVKVPVKNLLPLPDNVDFELGALTDPAAIATGVPVYISRPALSCRGAGQVLRRGAAVEEAPTQLRNLFRFPVHGMPVYVSIPPDCRLGVGQVLSVEFPRAVM